MAASASARRLGRFTTADQALSGINIKGKVAVVTGGNSGVGLETCRALARAGARVYLCARNTQLGEAAVEDIRSSGGADVRLLQVDLSDLVSVREAAEKLRAAEPALHMLILNAGVMACPLTRTAQGLELQMGVNHVAHAYLTQLLLPCLTSHGGPARVVAVSSMAHTMAKKFDQQLTNLGSREGAGLPAVPYDPWPAYGNSKLANILFAKELAERLKGTQVQAFSLHPGIIFTNLQRYTSSIIRAIMVVLYPWSKTAQQGASTSVVAATAPELSASSGAYLDNCRVATCSSQGQDEQLAKRLWEATEKLLGELLGKVAS